MYSKGPPNRMWKREIMPPNGKTVVSPSNAVILKATRSILGLSMIQRHPKTPNSFKKNAILRNGHPRASRATFGPFLGHLGNILGQYCFIFARLFAILGNIWATFWRVHSGSLVVDTALPVSTLFHMGLGHCIFTTAHAAASATTAQLTVQPTNLAQ